MELPIEKPSINWVDLPPDMHKVIVSLLTVRGLLNLASTSSSWRKFLWNNIFNSADPEHRRYLQIWLQHYANEGNLYDNLARLPQEALRYYPQDSAELTTLIVISKFLASDVYDQDLFNKLLLLATDERTCIEVIRCLTPYFMLSKERQIYGNDLYNQVSTRLTNVGFYGQRSPLEIVWPQINQLVAIIPWQKKDKQTRLTKEDAITILKRMIPEVSKSNISFVLPRSLVAAKDTIVADNLDKLKPESIQSATQAINNQILFNINLANQYLHFLTPNQASDYQQCLLHVAQLVVREIPSVTLDRESNLQAQLLDVLISTIQHLDLFLHFSLATHCKDESDQLIRMMKELLQSIQSAERSIVTKMLSLLLKELFEHDDYDDLMKCQRIDELQTILNNPAYYLSNVKSAYSHLVSDQDSAYQQFKAAATDIIEAWDKNKPYIIDPVLLFKNHIKILTSLTKSNDPKLRVKSYQCFLSLNLLNDGNKDQVLTDLLEFNNQKFYPIWSEALKMISQIIRNFKLNDNQLENIISFCTNVLTKTVNAHGRGNLSPYIESTQQCLADIHCKYPAFKAPRLANSSLFMFWQQRRALTSRSASMYFFCSNPLEFHNEYEIQHSVNTSAVAVFIRNRTKIVTLIYTNLKIPFHQALNLTMSIINQDQNKLTQVLSNILKDPIAKLETHSCFKIFSFLHDVIKTQLQTNRSGSIPNEDNLFYTLRASALDILGEIVEKIPDQDKKIQFLKDARNQLIFKEHFSINSLHQIGRSGGEIAIDKMIQQIERASHLIKLSS